MKYHLSFDHGRAHRRHLVVRLELPPSPTARTLRLPRWRPGRYEMMDYASNVFEVGALTQSGQPAALERVGTHEWILPPQQEAVTVQHKYHAAVLDAGRSYLDDSQLYVNPCNLLLYLEEEIQQPCTLELPLPQGWELAVGLPRQGNVLHARDFHELADSPFFASPTLRKIPYQVAGVNFICWFQGEVRLSQERVQREFAAFTAAMHRMFGGFPFSEYHFLFQFVEDKFHHGVEHQNNTVIVLGPGRRMHMPSPYAEFLGISSHELFHAWNVKSIRPADMMPYDYGRAQYSRLHYVTEGVTTYYGDMMLLKGGVWNLEAWLEAFNEGDMDRFFSNQGGRYVSLEQSSFESWTVGYSAGVPNRKISFYSKGAIVAFMLDMRIRMATGNRGSLDDVMRLLYERFGKTGKGYTRADYLGLVNEVAKADLSEFFDLHISGTKPLHQELTQCARHVGLSLVEVVAGSSSIHALGLVLDEDVAGWPVKLVLEDSPADRSGLAVGDQIITVNGMRAGSRLDDLLVHLMPEDATDWQDLPTLELMVLRQGRLRQITLQPQQSFTAGRWRLAQDPDATPEQLANRTAWMGLPA